MFGRVIWDKLPACIFENFEIARVKRGQFQNFCIETTIFQQRAITNQPAGNCKIIPLTVQC